MLSPDHAFVIHLDTKTDLSSQRPVGRIEHVCSGDAAHFHSLTDLFEFFSRYFAETGGPSTIKRP